MRRNRKLESWYITEFKDEKEKVKLIEETEEEQMREEKISEK